MRTHDPFNPPPSLDWGFAGGLVFCAVVTVAFWSVVLWATGFFEFAKPYASATKHWLNEPIGEQDAGVAMLVLALMLLKKLGSLSRNHN